MGWSINIGRFGGTTLRVHVTFLILLVWIWFMHYRVGGTGEAWKGVLFIVAVFACVVLHEFGHIAAARRYGIRTPDITLLPIGGVARMERIPEAPLQEFIVAIAGPLVNVVIAGVILLALGRTVGLSQIAEVADPRVDFLARLAGVNLFLVLFNLIPAFPMDGGRVLRAALASWLGWPRATLIAAGIGQALAFVFGFVGLFYNPLLLFIAIFVYLAAASEAESARIRDISANLVIDDVMMRDFERIDRSATLGHAIDRLLATAQSEFPVVDEHGRLEGLVTRNDMIRVLHAEGPDAPAVDAMHTDIPVVAAGTALSEAFRRMQETEAAAVAATDAGGRLIGLLTRETVGEMMMVRAAAPGGYQFARRRSAERAWPAGSANVSLKPPLR